MNLYVVHGVIAGYTREDPKNSKIYGVFTDSRTAAKVASVNNGEISQVELNFVSPGIKQMLKQLFNN